MNQSNKSACDTCGVNGYNINGTCSDCIMKQWKVTGMLPIGNQTIQHTDINTNTIESRLNDSTFQYIEYLGDLIALGSISPELYYKLKHMLKSMDADTYKMAKNIIDKRIKTEDPWSTRT